MNRQNKIDTNWSGTLAYLVGVIATDGNLSPDGRHINITSKDTDWLTNIRDTFKLTCKIGKKARERLGEKKYAVLQIGDKRFYNFLLNIGLTTNKSLSIAELNVPKLYFNHFLRGCFDGDGSVTSSAHPLSKHQQLRIRLYSASSLFLSWIQKEISEQCGTKGRWIISDKRRSVKALSYGKADSIIVLDFIYQKSSLCLERKFVIAKSFIGQVAKLVSAPALGAGIARCEGSSPSLPTKNT